MLWIIILIHTIMAQIQIHPVLLLKHDGLHMYHDHLVLPNDMVYNTFSAIEKNLYQFHINKTLCTIYNKVLEFLPNNLKIYIIKINIEPGCVRYIIDDKYQSAELILNLHRTNVELIQEIVHYSIFKLFNSKLHPHNDSIWDALQIPNMNNVSSQDTKSIVYQNWITGKYNTKCDPSIIRSIHYIQKELYSISTQFHTIFKTLYEECIIQNKNNTICWDLYMSYNSRISSYITWIISILFGLFICI